MYKLTQVFTNELKWRDVGYRVMTISCYLHTVLLETDVRHSDFVVIFFQLTQNWTALNFEVNFRPLIQWDSSGLFSKSLMKLSNLLSEREIRTSEDVRASYKDIMLAIVNATFTERMLTQPLSFA